jgi:PilZ domain-containing protein
MLASAMMRERQTTASPLASLTESEGLPHRAPTPDRRKRRRVPLALVARIEAVSAAVSATDARRRADSTIEIRPAISHRAVTGRLRDISNHGAYLWSGQSFAPGQTLRLILEVPPDQGRNWALEIQCEAEVLRVEPGNPRTGETGLAVRIAHFNIPKVLSATEALFPPGDQTD